MLNTIRDIRKKILRPWGMGGNQDAKRNEYFENKKGIPEIKTRQAKIFKSCSIYEKVFHLISL